MPTMHQIYFIHHISPPSNLFRPASGRIRQISNHPLQGIHSLLRLALWYTPFQCQHSATSLPKTYMPNSSNTILNIPLLSTALQMRQSHSLNSASNRSICALVVHCCAAPLLSALSKVVKDLRSLISYIRVWSVGNLRLCKVDESLQLWSTKEIYRFTGPVVSRCFSSVIPDSLFFRFTQSEPQPSNLCLLDCPPRVQEGFCSVQKEVLKERIRI